MKLILLAFSALIYLSANAQDKIEYSTYDWDETFDRVKYDASEYPDQAATILLDRTVMAYKHEGVKKLGIAGRIYHKVAWIQEESSIEELNRLYLREGASVKIKSIKVRTITKAGEVVMLDESNMEDVSKDDGNANYRILAIPGIEVGSWVEIFINYDGLAQQNRFIVREPYYVVHSDVIFQAFEYAAPYGYMHQTPHVKGYNGFEQKYIKVGKEDTIKKLDLSAQPEGYKTELKEQNKELPKSNFKERNSWDKDLKNIKERKYYHFSMDSIPPNMTDEKYAHEYEFCPRVDITLTTYKWSQISQGMYGEIFPSAVGFHSNGLACRKVLAEIGAKEGEEGDKLIAIDNFVKQKIAGTESGDKLFESVLVILKDRVANETGILRTFAALFNHADIEYEIYFVADKDYIKPDKKMKMTFGLSYYLFYFPNSDMYIMPTNKYYRAGAIPNYLAGCLRLELFSDLSGGFLKRLPKADKNFNVFGTKSTVKLDLNEDLVEMDLVETYYGDCGMRVRGDMNYMSAAEKDEYIHDILVSKLKDAELSNVTVINDAISHNNVLGDTLTFKGHIQTEDMLTAVGSDYLFNLTKAMGYQSSFYDESDRTNDLYIQSAKVYEHEIKFIIPEGYTLEGTDALEFDRIYETDVEVESSGEAVEKSGETIASFKSTVRIQDGILNVKVVETYEEGFYPKEDLQAFQNVINAAYEFYSVKLKLTKK
ncbi:MAG: hypothetical protein ACI837_002009 [Crocinitomicaceae bacterium]|jgi:hypothetical protein